MENLDNIKSKLQKLIRLQESAEKIGSMAEALNAAARIEEMLVKYNISMMDVAEKEQTKMEVVEEKSEFCFNKKWGNNQRIFIAIIKKYSFTDIINYREYLLILGDPENVKTSQHMINYFWDYFRLCLSEDMKAYKQGGKLYAGQKPGAFKRDYLGGFNTGLRMVLENKAKESNITAIIKYNAEAIQLHIQEKIGPITTKTVKSSTKRNAANFLGFQSGANADTQRKAALRN